MKFRRFDSHLPLAALAATPALGVCLTASWMAAGVLHNPPVTATFGEATKGMQVVEQYLFGTGRDRTVATLSQLASLFEPYGISGTTVINQEWQRYQPFNQDNFVFSQNALALTATIPKGGGLFPSGIHSGQIWTKRTYKPGTAGLIMYGFEVRMKIPAGQGMWPAAWFFTKQPDMADTSEIDNPEFFNMKWQGRFDWTGFQHGPGEGPELFSIKTNQWVWHPGFDFAADYHNYQTLWTADAVYKYVDGKLIYAASFQWTAPGAAQLGVNLAVGTSATEKLPGLQPNSLAEFPSTLSIEHIIVWAR